MTFVLSGKMTIMKPNWTLIKIRLGDIVAYEQNPRLSTKAQAQRIIASERKFNQVVPFIVSPYHDSKVKLYDGHQRLSAWLTVYGADHVMDAMQCDRDLTDDEHKELIITMHSGATGSWDWNALSGWPAGKLQEWGMDKDTLKDWNNDALNLKELLNAEQPMVDAEPQTDRAAELQVKWQTETGQLWQLGKHRLLIGDCTVRENVERLMGGEKVDISFSSPPYNVGNNAKLSPHQENGAKYIDNSDNKSDDDYLSFLTLYIVSALEFCEYVFMNVQSLANNKTVLIDLLYTNKDVYADTLIWDKVNAQPAMAENVLNSQFEYVHVFSNKANRSIGTSAFRGTLSNVVQIHKRSSEVKEHNASFSVEFAEYFIKNFSTNTTYDPFCGSGTTIIAAQNLSRRCYAMEISPAYCAVILERFHTAFPDIEITKI
jgi:DNA modification methylase